MNNVLRLSLAASLALALANCSEVLQTVDLTVSTEDNSAQEAFNVVEKTLTLAEARAQMRAPYPRRVIQSGRGAVAGPIAEGSLTSASFPRSAKAAPYRIGAGDRVNFTRLIDNQANRAAIKENWPPKKGASAYKLGARDKIILRRLLDTSASTANNTEIWPNVSQNKPYTIGVGDELALIQINESENSDAQATTISRNLDNAVGSGVANNLGQNVIRTTGRIGSDGSVLLLEVGRLDASGKTLTELRSEVRNILIRNGLSPKFQLDIVSFASQRAYISVGNAGSDTGTSSAQVITLTDKPITLRELLSRSGVGFSQSVETFVRLQRSGKTYVMKLRTLYSGAAQDIVIQDRDHVFVESSISTKMETIASVGQDGSAVLEGLGRIKLAGRTLSDIETEIKQRLSSQPASQQTFQIEIAEFASQRAYMTLNAAGTANEGQGGRVLTLTDQPITLREVLSQAGIGLSPRTQTKIELQRDGQSYVMDLARIYSNGSPEIIIQDRDHIFVEEGISQTVGTTALVGQDGFVVLEGIGKINVAGKTVDQVSQEINSALANTSAAGTDFQIEVVEFASQRALISIPGAVGEQRGTQTTTGINVGNASGAIVPITNIPITLEEALTERGVTLDGQYITRIALQRAGRKYSFTLRDLLETTSARVYLQGGDRVTVERLGYKSNKVFVLGGVTPTIVNIDPEIRQTLADILFTSDGVLSAPGANRSEVYLLRGTDPVVAYHLDAQSPTRLIVADAMELRPNDILYVAEQPIVSFNRTLATITPLRAVLQEIGNELN